jgi:hypothetical protein
MKVLGLSQQVVKFRTGEPLAPEELNRIFLYAQDAVADVAERRWALSSLTFPFVLTMTAGLTNASAARLRTIRFSCPLPCVVQRAYLNGNVTAAADLQVHLYQAGTTTLPAGATSPYLSTGIVASPTEDTQDINVDKVRLPAGLYDLVISGTSFTTERLDVTLDIAVDRWFATGSLDEPAFSPRLFTDEVPDALAVDDNVDLLAIEAAKFATSRPLVGHVLWAQDFVSGTDVDLRSFRLPQVAGARGVGDVVGYSLWVAMTDATGGTVTATLTPPVGSPVVIGGAVGAVVEAFFDGTVTPEAVDAGDAEDSADDWAVAFANTSAANACTRAVLVLWVEI